MKTLAEEIAAVLRPDPQPLGAIASDLGADTRSIRRAAQALHDDAKVLFVRRGRVLHLVSLEFQGTACKHCYIEFKLPRKSKRQCCSRACGIAWSWTRPGVREKRRAGIATERATPGAKARTASLNEMRWSRPGEREKLAEQSRQRWADPSMAAKLAAGIRAAQGSTEQRKIYSDIRREQWKDPEFRAKTTAGIRKSKGSPEARAKFSKLLKARWDDPEGRKIYLAGVRKTALKMAERNRGKKQTPEQIAKRVESTKAAKARRGRETSP